MEGVMLLPNDDDLTCVQALIEGPVDTPYHGGIFRVRLKLGNDFPMAPPKGTLCSSFFFFFLLFSNGHFDVVWDAFVRVCCIVNLFSKVCL